MSDPTTPKEALEAAFAAKPMAYELTGIIEELERIYGAEELKRIFGDDYAGLKQVSIIFIGCQGSGTQDQYKVAKLAEETAARLLKEGKPVIFAYYLGDNVYDYGASSPQDMGFTQCFHKIYSALNPGLKLWPRIRAWLIPGNHDENIHKKSSFSSNPVGKETGMHQVAHHYLLGDLKQRIEAFSQSQLPFSAITEQYNMPARHYSLQLGNMQIISCNANNLAKSFLKLKKGMVKPGKINQAAFLRDEAQKAREAGREVIFTTHVVPDRTCGKRAFPDSYDTLHYMKKDKLHEINELLGTQIESHNELIGAIFDDLGLSGTVIGAHDHFLHYFNNAQDETPGVKKSVLITSGGGGGAKQEQMSFKGHPYENHVEDNGLTVISFDPNNPKELEIELCNVQGQRLLFTNASHEPLYGQQNANVTDEQKNAHATALMLRQVIEEACQNYFSNLKELEIQKTQQTTPPPASPTAPSMMSSLLFYAKSITPTAITNAVTTVTDATVSLASELKKRVNYNKTQANEVRLVNLLRTEFNQAELPPIMSLTRYLEEKIADLEKLNNQALTAFLPLLRKQLSLHATEAAEDDKKLLETFLPRSPSISPPLPR